MTIDPVDDPPVAEDLSITVYSGRSTTVELPAWDPDGTELEIYILTEPQGGANVLSLTDETTVGSTGNRRKVRSQISHGHVLDRFPAHIGSLLPSPGYKLFLGSRYGEGQMYQKLCIESSVTCAGHGSDRNTDFLSTSGPRLLENLQVQAVPSSLFLPLPSVVVVVPIVLSCLYDMGV